MWFALGKLFLGGIGSIGKEIRLAQEQKLKAKNTTERIAADTAIATLDARKSVMIADAGRGWAMIFRGFLALPFGLYAWKYVVWDKMFGLGSTPPLSDKMWDLMLAVYSFYFLFQVAGLFKKK